MVEGFKEVAKRLEGYGLAVAVVGSSYFEGTMAQEIGKELSKNGFCDVSGLDLPLGKLAAFISLARIFVGNDSGPLHIAACAGVDSVGIYGTSVPEKTGPVLAPGTKFKAVCSRYPCSPCRERFFKDCQPVDGKPPCIANITVEDVVGAIEKILQ